MSRTASSGVDDAPPRRRRRGSRGPRARRQGVCPALEDRQGPPMSSPRPPQSSRAGGHRGRAGCAGPGASQPDDARRASPWMRPRPPSANRRRHTDPVRTTWSAAPAATPTSGPPSSAGEDDDGRRCRVPAPRAELDGDALREDRRDDEHEQERERHGRADVDAGNAQSPAQHEREAGSRSPRSVPRRGSATPVDGRRGAPGRRGRLACRSVDCSRTPQ